MEETSGEKGIMSNNITTAAASASASSSLMFPGFKFSPTDEELISYYLKNKIQDTDDNCLLQVISQVDICKYEPWDLPGKAVIESQNEWFFFSPRGKKYPNGSQSRRATASGYWKATGKERNVKSGSNLIGTKRTLVFHTGRAPKGERTEWIMHEYCMSGNSQDSFVVCRLRKNAEFRLNDTPRKNSLTRRHLPTGNDGASPSSAVNIEQTLGFEGANAFDCCSKDCSHGYHSHSVEQVDSASESDQRPTNEFSRHDSSSYQDCDDEDDCFADIMKDDIIKLDESSSLPKTPDLLPMVVRKSEADTRSEQSVQPIMSPALPFQGTANRRLRLCRQRLKNYNPETLKAFEIINEDSLAEGFTQDSQQSPGYFISMLSNIGAGCCSMSVCSIMLVLFLCLFGGSWKLNIRFPSC